jgi:protein-disulfide isomerase
MTRATELPKLVSPRWRRRAIAATLLLFALVASLVFFRALTVRSRAPTRSASSAHAPWVYGRPTARFTVIEYADLECPYCRTYFPVLRHWIDEHPQVNWEWWNLPLPMHEPAATREALLAECVGEEDGNRAFWRAVEWIYRHTRGDGAGVTAGTRMPGISPTIQACLKSGRAAKVIRAQAVEAAREHVLGTPTLRILDHKTGRSLDLQGPVAADSLLSGIDWLATPEHHSVPSVTSR